MECLGDKGGGKRCHHVAIGHHKAERVDGRGLNNRNGTHALRVP